MPPSLTNPRIVYDCFGNRWQQNSPAGSIYTSNLTFTGNATNNNNRMDPAAYIAPLGNVTLQYDSAGNLQFDGAHQYLYDAENRLIQVDGSLPYCTSNAHSGSAATACYYYDADGKRVHRTGYTNDNCDNTGKRGYLFDLSGRVIVQDNVNGTACDVQAYAGDRHFGRQGGGSYFYHSDWLGTVRKIISDQFLLNGSVQTCTSLPFGDGLNCNSNASNVWHFTGQERDYETGSGSGAQNGLDYFHARHYTSNMGRFMSPDPENAGANALNPQSWNAYAYAGNNPLANIDPTGRECVWDDGSYDSYNDPDSGDPDKCGNLGGTWIGHDVFANSQYYRGDWSGDPNHTLSGLVSDVQACTQAVGGGKGASLLIANAFASGFSDDQTAYLLATAAWESGPGGLGNHMTELGSAAYFKKYDGRLGNNNPGDGALYRGRGYVQVTGKANYQTWSNELGVDLVQHPTLAATPDVAAQIAVEGTDRGSFRANLSLYDFINPSGTDFFDARGVINGDKNVVPRGGTINNGGAIANIATNFSNSLSGCR